MKLLISTAPNRKATTWRSEEVEWRTFSAFLTTRKDTAETAAQYAAMTKEQRGEIKDVGGFVGGVLRDNQRKKGNVLFRTLLCLDVDEGTAETLENVKKHFKQYAFALYTTHSHTDESPRFRLVFPLEEKEDNATRYEAVCRHFARLIGIETVDFGSYQMERLMYYPSCSIGAPFYAYVNDGAPLSTALVAGGAYANYKDYSQWPKSKREKARWTSTANNKGVELKDKPNIIKAFCKVYDIHTAIKTFIPEVYKQEDATHYTYKNGSGVRGLAILEGGALAYSHHSTDPANTGHALNAFDLVRIHLFSSLDTATDYKKESKCPSFTAMEKLLEDNEEIKREIITRGLDLDKLEEYSTPKEESSTSREEKAPKEKRKNTVEPWVSTLIKMLTVDNKTGKVQATAANIDKILKHTPAFDGALVFDAFALKRKVKKDLPWRKLDEGGEFWTDEDEAGVRGYIEDVWGISHNSKTQDAVTRYFVKHRENPPKDFITSFKWDGVERVETLFIDYLGATDTPLNRAITRKTMAASVARILHPGVKYDQITIFAGREGIGKSTLIKKLGGEWYSDSITTVEGKEAMEQLSGVWFVELAELQALKRSEITATKSFVSKTADRYRPAYGRNTIERPRQCVFFATTNEMQFLKNETGNRRMWVLEVGGKANKSPFDLDEETRGQIFAEAIELYKKGEPLYLNKEESAELVEAQKAFEVFDERAGVILDYLDTPIPLNWYELSKQERISYFKDLENPVKISTHKYNISVFESTGEMPEGYMLRTRVCIPEIKAEALGFDNIRMQDQRESRAITLALKSLGNFEKTGEIVRFKGYGTQRKWARVKAPEKAKKMTQKIELIINELM